MSYLASSKEIFRAYKKLAEKAIAQVENDQLFIQPHPESNSIAIIVQHLSGNMLSRWTNFLSSDGEKPWRLRDREFEPVITSGAELQKAWEKGWNCLFDALDTLQEEDLVKTVFIRNEPHTALEAINRQIAHYAYHTGQIVYLAKSCQAANGRLYRSQKINRKILIAKNSADKFIVFIFPEIIQMAHKKKLAATILLLLSVIMMSFTVSEEKEQPGFKNLKVLPKNISHDDLVAIMKNYCAALGVKCGHCHTKTGDKFDWADDSKEEKRIARKMQTMTNAINKKYFGGNTGTVACMTCHNGKIHPSDASASAGEKPAEVKPGDQPAETK
jgi:hypothetical protein